MNRYFILFLFSASLVILSLFFYINHDFSGYGLWHQLWCEFGIPLKHDVAVVMRVMSDYPLTGIGLGYYSRACLLPQYLEQTEFQRYNPHSLYGSWLIAFGVIGLISLIMVVLYCIYSGRYLTGAPSGSTSKVHLLSKAGLIVFSLGAFFYNPLDNQRVIVHFWILMSLLLVDVNDNKDKSSAIAQDVRNYT